MLKVGVCVWKITQKKVVVSFCALFCSPLHVVLQSVAKAKRLDRCLLNQMRDGEKEREQNERTIIKRSFLNAFIHNGMYHGSIQVFLFHFLTLLTPLSSSHPRVCLSSGRDNSFFILWVCTPNLAIFFLAYYTSNVWLLIFCLSLHFIPRGFFVLWVLCLFSDPLLVPAQKTSILSITSRSTPLRLRWMMSYWKAQLSPPPFSSQENRWGMEKTHRPEIGFSRIAYMRGGEWEERERGVCGQRMIYKKVTKADGRQMHGTSRDRWSSCRVALSFFFFFAWVNGLVLENTSSPASTSSSVACDGYHFLLEGKDPKRIFFAVSV